MKQRPSGSGTQTELGANLLYQAVSDIMILIYGYSIELSVFLLLLVTKTVQFSTRCSNLKDYFSRQIFLAGTHPILEDYGCSTQRYCLNILILQ